MRQSRTSGSVGGWGEKSPWSTRRSRLLPRRLEFSLETQGLDLHLRFSFLLCLQQRRQNHGEDIWDLDLFYRNLVVERVLSCGEGTGEEARVKGLRGKSAARAARQSWRREPLAGDFAWRFLGEAEGPCGLGCPHLSPLRGMSRYANHLVRWNQK